MFSMQARLRMESIAEVLSVVGVAFYLTSLFFMEGNGRKIIFYVLIALPALFSFRRIAWLCRTQAWPVVSVLAFLLYFSASALWSGIGEEAFFDALKYSLFICCLMVGISVTVEKCGPTSIVNFLIVVGAVASCFYIVMIVLRTADFDVLFASRSALAGLVGIGESNPIASAIILGLPVIAAWWQMAGRKWQVQLGLVLFIAINLMLMFLTKSRGPLFSLLIVLVAISLCRRSREDLALLVAGLLAGLALMLGSDFLTLVSDRLAEPTYRLDIWAQSLELIRQHWLVGQGYGKEADILIRQNVLVTHSHSSVLEVFRLGGILGGALFFFMCMQLGLKAIRSRQGGFFLCWLVFGVLCLSSNGRMLLSRPSIEWFCFWFPLFFLFFSYVHAPQAQVAEAEPDGGRLPAA